MNLEFNSQWPSCCWLFLSLAKRPLPCRHRVNCQHGGERDDDDQSGIIRKNVLCGKVRTMDSCLPIFISSGLYRSAHRRRKPGMFKGIGVLPQRAKTGWVYTQTLLAQFIVTLQSILFDDVEKCRKYGHNIAHIG